MTKTLAILIACVALLGAAGCGASAQPVKTAKKGAPTPMRVEKTDAEWRQTLTPQQYDVLRKKGTERAFSGALWNRHEDGTYRCAGCGHDLFGSAAKFDSGTGWPSFYQPVGESHVATETDRTFFMSRTEVHCARCGGHLGHVFNDGPKPTGLRYCINSAALTFEKK